MYLCKKGTMMEQKVHIVDGKRELFLPLDDIIFVKADGNYCDFYLQNASYTAVRIQIGRFFELLSENNKNGQIKLERVGRSFVVNLQLLTKVDIKKGTITLRTNTGVRELTIAKAAAKELLKNLNTEKRREVLSDYAVKRSLNGSINELNDEHFTVCGHEYIDLGLPSGLLWAAEDIGDESYFAWGEIEEKDEYTEDTYDVDERDLTELVLEFDPYFPSETYTEEYDVARHNWGKPWHCPSLENFDELHKYCDLIWCSTQDHMRKGCLVIGPNGNRMFLPACGYMKGDECIGDNHVVSFWSTSASCHQEYHAWSVQFKEIVSTYDHEEIVGCEIEDNHNMFIGMCVRPVISKDDIKDYE